MTAVLADRVNQLERVALATVDQLRSSRAVVPCLIDRPRIRHLAMGRAVGLCPPPLLCGPRWQTTLEQIRRGRHIQPHGNVLTSGAQSSSPILVDNDGGIRSYHVVVAGLNQADNFGRLLKVRRGRRGALKQGTAHESLSSKYLSAPSPHNLGEG